MKLPPDTQAYWISKCGIQPMQGGCWRCTCSVTEDEEVDLGVFKHAQGGWAAAAIAHDLTLIKACHDKGDIEWSTLDDLSLNFPVFTYTNGGGKQFFTGLISNCTMAEWAVKIKTTNLAKDALRRCTILGSRGKAGGGVSPAEAQERPNKRQKPGSEAAGEEGHAANGEAAGTSDQVQGLLDELLNQGLPGILQNVIASAPPSQQGQEQQAIMEQQEGEEATKLETEESEEEESSSSEEEEELPPTQPQELELEPKPIKTKKIASPTKTNKASQEPAAVAAPEDGSEPQEGPRNVWLHSSMEYPPGSGWYPLYIKSKQIQKGYFPIVCKWV